MPEGSDIAGAPACARQRIPDRDCYDCGVPNRRFNAARPKNREPVRPGPSGGAATRRRHHATPEATGRRHDAGRTAAVPKRATRHASTRIRPGRGGRRRGRDAARAASPRGRGNGDGPPRRGGAEPADADEATRGIGRGGMVRRRRARVVSRPGESDPPGARGGVSGRRRRHRRRRGPDRGFARSTGPRPRGRRRWDRGPASRRVPRAASGRRGAAPGRGGPSGCGAASVSVSGRTRRRSRSASGRRRRWK